MSTDTLPLRGFLECPDCHRMLTGSASKGRHGNYYHYYHCTGNCKCRFKGGLVNEYFENDLLNFQLAPGTSELYKARVMDVFRSENRTGLDERKALAGKIEEQEKMLSNARKRYMTDEIDAEDFKAVKKGCNEELRKLEAGLADLPNKSESLKNSRRLVRYCYFEVHQHSAALQKRKYHSLINVN